MNGCLELLPIAGVSSLDHLLFRGESESLDFKRDQYAFVGATDDQKAKLLKDILAFANSWRSEKAFILIGVDAPVGATPQVFGITQHLDDAALQQFVNSKTQRPVEFRYFETELCGKTIGVIEIPLQRRPLHTVTNFAGVRASMVYTRRGSSNAEATPDEIARMGASVPEVAGSDLHVSFAVPSGRQLSGASIELNCVDLSLDEPDGIPDYSENDGYFVPVIGANQDFWRDLVKYVTVTGLMRPVALTVSNRGKLVAKDIRVEFAIPDPDYHLRFLEQSGVPKLPTRRFNYASLNMPRAMADAIKGPPFEAEYVADAWHVAFNFGTLQPSRTLFPPIPFWVGSKQSQSLEIVGRVFAENLPAPAECKLNLKFTSIARRANLDKLEVDYQNALAAMPPEDD